MLQMCSKNPSVSGLVSECHDCFSATEWKDQCTDHDLFEETTNFDTSDSCVRLQLCSFS